MAFIDVFDVAVEDIVFKAKFACDYDVCHGACCCMPAPSEELIGGLLTDYEAAEILHNRKELSELCDKPCKELVAEKPVEKYNGNFYTTLRCEKCVFSSNVMCGCVLKSPEAKKLTDIGIPHSCQLYPLVFEAHNEKKTLVLGDIFDSWCSCGYIKGSKEGIYLIDFLKDAIIRFFGKPFYDALKEKQKDFIKV